MTSAKTPARILIVDDHPMMRDGLTIRISNEPDLAVCGEADDVAEALRRVGELNPDLVIIDISLKTGHGIDLVKQIRARHPKMKMLVNSMYDESVYAERSLQAGAMGYLNKQTVRETVIDAIRTVLAGKTYLSPEMTDRILKSRVGGMIEPGKSPIESLSDREMEVFDPHRPRSNHQRHRQATPPQRPHHRHLSREAQDQTQPRQRRRTQPLRRAMGAGEWMRKWKHHGRAAMGI